MSSQDKANSGNLVTAGRRDLAPAGAANPLVSRAIVDLTNGILELMQDDWTGKCVVLLKGNKRVEIRQSNKTGCSAFLGELRQLVYIVIKDQGGFLKVSENGIEGWFDKSDAVILERAIDHFTAQIRTKPGDASCYVNRAVAWNMKGKVDKAIIDCEEAMRLDPGRALPYDIRGNSWMRRRDYDQAIRDYSEAIRLDPTFVSAYVSRGAARLEKKEYDRAIKDWDEAIWLDRRCVGAYFGRGLAWLRKNEYEKTIKDWEEAIWFDSKCPSAADALAWLLATCPEERIRDGKRAIQMATKACNRTNWKTGWHLDILAAAYAETGQFDEAQRYQTNALEDQSCNVPIRDGFRKRLDLYKQKRPYRESS
jgi:Tfp pilus assembly protein PilF